MRRPNLNSLRIFEAAARHGSFTLAGNELHVTQAAVSQQVRKLEAYLGAMLFKRLNRRVILTDDGIAYYPVVHEVLSRLDAVTDQLFPSLHQKTVTLKTTASIATLWLAPRLGRLRNLHPWIDLRVRTLAGDSKSQGNDDTDLEIVIGDSEEGGSHCRELLQVTIVPVCSQNLIASFTQLTAPGDLMHQELIHVLGYEDDWHRWFQRNGVDTVNTDRGQHFDSSLIALESTLNGNGIMLGRRPFIDQYLQSGDLIMPFENCVALTTIYNLRRRETGINQAAVNTIAQWLIDEADLSSCNSTS